jgi:hypothetical protein
MTPESVTIGGVSKPQLLRMLREKGIRFNRAADVLFDDGRFETSEHERVVEIATVTVADLGFADGATYAELVSRANESQMAECPLELGPHLRLHFMDQPEVTSDSTTKGEAPPGSITIASAPLDDADDTPKGFYLLSAEGILWLRGYWSGPDHRWKPQDRFVFSREG